MDIQSRHRDLLRHLWHAGPASRSELAARLALRPNTVGDLANELIELRVLQEGESAARKVGRPRVPLEIDPQGRRVLGLALTPGRIHLQLLDLLGKPCPAPIDTPLETCIELDQEGGEHPIDRAAELLQRLVGPHLLAIGLTVTGFVERQARRILFSSVLPDERSISLDPLWRAATDTPIQVGNDMHAMAARWLMDERDPVEDVLLVHYGDGSLGAMHLIDGRPSRGSITSANELGHSRFFVDTAACYCGHSGCLERICSTDFLRRCDASAGSRPTVDHDLASRIRAFEAPAQDPGLDRLAAYLATGITNAVNFSRPHRLVLVDDSLGGGAFVEHLADRIRAAVLPALADRLSIQCPIAAGAGAEAAAWLALAGLYREGWEWRK